MPSPTPLVILGASAWGEAASLVRDINAAGSSAYEAVALLDDDPAWHGQQLRGVPVRGPLDRWVDFPEAQFVFLIGSHRSRVLRRGLFSRLGVPRDRFATLVHPSAVIFDGASIGRGCLLYSGAVVFHDTAVEDFVIVLPNSVVGGRCTVAEFALLASSVSVGSDVRIGPCAHLGAGCTVAEGVEVGAGGQVMMGAFLPRDLPDGAAAIGNPARAVKRIDLPGELTTWWAAHPSRTPTPDRHLDP